jgi:hypothetical protein
VLGVLALAAQRRHELREREQMEPLRSSRLARSGRSRSVSALRCAGDGCRDHTRPESGTTFDSGRQRVSKAYVSSSAIAVEASRFASVDEQRARVRGKRRRDQRPADVEQGQAREERPREHDRESRRAGRAMRGAQHDRAHEQPEAHEHAAVHGGVARGQDQARLAQEVDGHAQEQHRAERGRRGERPS